jgi:hypothetical protein
VHTGQAEQTLIHSVARLLLAIAEPQLKERESKEQRKAAATKVFSPESLENSIADDARCINFDL